MDDIPLPLVDGCYLDSRGNMFKVKLIEFQGGAPTRILVEDIFSKIHRLSLTQWQRKPMIPCCMSRGPGQTDMLANTASVGGPSRSN